MNNEKQASETVAEQARDKVAAQIDSIATAMKSRADAITSTISAATVVSVLIGSVWIVAETAALPDGIPRLDAASFTALASAVALTGIWVLSLIVIISGAPGYMFRFRRTGPLERQNYWPFTSENRTESVYALALLSWTIIALIVLDKLSQPIPWIFFAPFLAIPSTMFFASELRDAGRVPKFLLTSFEGVCCWYTLVFFANAIAGAAHAENPGLFLYNIWIVIISLVFFGALTTYLASIAKWPVMLSSGLLFVLVVATFSWSSIRAAPFRVLKLVDVAIRFPQPETEQDRDALATLTSSCDKRVLERLADHSYQVFVRQRIGSDWTISCSGDGTVTFPRAFVPGEMPLVTPTPSSR